MVALISVSSSSSPLMASCKCLGVILFTLRSFEQFPANSSTWWIVKTDCWMTSANWTTSCAWRGINTRAVDTLEYPVCTKEVFCLLWRERNLSHIKLKWVMCMAIAQANVSSDGKCQMWDLDVFQYTTPLLRIRIALEGNTILQHSNDLVAWRTESQWYCLQFLWLNTHTSPSFVSSSHYTDCEMIILNNNTGLRSKSATASVLMVSSSLRLSSTPRWLHCRQPLLLLRVRDWWFAAWDVGGYAPRETAIGRTLHWWRRQTKRSHLDRESLTGQWKERTSHTHANTFWYGWSVLPLDPKQAFTTLYCVPFIQLTCKPALWDLDTALDFTLASLPALPPGCANETRHHIL